MKKSFFNERVNIKKETEGTKEIEGTEETKGIEGTKEIEGTWEKQKALRVTEELLDLLSKSYCV